ncbi:putative membrane protein [Rahnella sp. BIGb0236]|uniref:PACE efflux transporter n=1 Tax=Rahnella sp. BIGb0236 TaxID=2485117 RepID=UPI001060A622|nr:PACE efflux transporter [Rahnella sp. BIGb0236]TDS84901.1 putative membrane protein [Rahnella sp. BIGb0236]
MYVELNKSVKERVYHALLFEILANLILSVFVSKMMNVTLTTAGVLSLISAFVATVWNYIFNFFFDKFQAKAGFSRTLSVRGIHTVSFELILIVTLTPFAMYILHLHFMQALSTEVGLVLFFIPYTLLNNGIYDYLRAWLIGNKLETR